MLYNNGQSEALLADPFWKIDATAATWTMKTSNFKVHRQVQTSLIH
jgi:hypothetical protein